MEGFLRTIQPQNLLAQQLLLVKEGFCSKSHAGHSALGLALPDPRCDHELVNYLLETSGVSDSHPTIGMSYTFLFSPFGRDKGL